MTAKPKPNPKRDSSGKFLPKWAGEMRSDLSIIAQTVVDLSKDRDRHERLINRLDKVEYVLYGIERTAPSEESTGGVGLVERFDTAINGLSSRLGTSTPLIIWNIAVLIALAGLSVAVARLYGVASY